MKNRIFIYLSFFILFVIPIKVNSQNKSLIHSFFKISFPEKIWAITHPFIAKKTWKISKEAIRITEELKNDTIFDADINGGQLDAFKHTFWMASLAQKISIKKARKLGLAHEKANYKNFKKEIKEGTCLNDAVSRDMDIKNNDYGINLGNLNKNLTQNELISLVKIAVLEGKVWIINKNKMGESLDCKDNILPKEMYFKKWETPRCLVKSDKKRI